MNMENNKQNNNNFWLWVFIAIIALIFIIY